MKRSRAEGAAPPSKSSADAAAKALRRQKLSTPRSAAGRATARPATSPEENAVRKGGGVDKSPAAAPAPAESQQSSYVPSAPAEEEGVVGWGDGVAELGEWWWCLWGVEEEKLSGWFPFVDEDFLCSDTRGGEGSGGLLWEEADHDIWQLQHIHEIPHTAAK